MAAETVQAGGRDSVPSHFDCSGLDRVGSVDAVRFRDALGQLATGITIVTTLDEGVAHAMTANAFTSVSLDPPLVLVCAEKRTRFRDAVLRSGEWGVSVLDERGRAASDWFARRGRPLAGQLSGFAHAPGRVTSCPLLCDALAWLECRTWAVHDGGDHTIVVGEVVDVDGPAQADSGGTPGPLVYFDGEYRTIASDH